MRIHDTFPINIRPDNRLLDELGKNNFNYVDILSEFIDNSIAARLEGQMLNVDIDIGIFAQKQKSYLKITDNACGIKTAQLSEALSPGGTSGGTTLNEHGLGMKQSIAAAGTLINFKTRHYTENIGTMITELRIDRPITATIIENVSEYGHGTSITIGNLKDLVETRKQIYTKKIIPLLGARYRRFLEGDSPLLTLTVSLHGDSGNDKTWNVNAISPVYFNAQKRCNEPLIYKKELKGRSGWRALLTFGYAPTPQQYLDMEMQPPKNYEPYHVTKNNQGLDILSHERVILFHQLYDLGIVSSHSDKYNRIRGEIELIYGFTSTITKNDFIRDENFRDLCNRIKAELEKKHYLDIITARTELPVTLLAHRLAAHFKAQKTYKSTRANIACPTGGTVDLLTNGEAIWKIVPSSATASDIYLLLGQLDALDISHGIILAKAFDEKATSVASFVATRYEKNIELLLLADYPINEAPSDYEFQRFFR